MIVRVPKEITMQIDSREKYPLLFPSIITVPTPEDCYKRRIIPVNVETLALPTGDYRLKGFEDICIVERKASVAELQKNLYNPTDQIRQAKAFRRLSAVEHPYLLIELSPRIIMKFKHPKFKINPEDMLHRLTIIAAKYKLKFLWMPKSPSPEARRITGLFLTHIMLSHVLERLYRIPIAVPETAMTDEELGCGEEELEYQPPELSEQET